MKRNYITGIFVIIICGNIYSQSLFSVKEKIIGIWQVDNAGIAAGLNNIYIFDAKNNFTFRLNSMENNLKKVVGIKGEYKIKNDSIYFKVTHTIEVRNGKVGRRDATAISSGWDYYGEKEIYVKNKNDYSDGLSIVYKKKGDYDVIIIDGDEYYLISKNPSTSLKSF